jgi:hypothetical protein
MNSLENKWKRISYQDFCVCDKICMYLYILCFLLNKVTFYQQYFCKTNKIYIQHPILIWYLKQYLTPTQAEFNYLVKHDM